MPLLWTDAIASIEGEYIVLAGEAGVHRVTHAGEPAAALAALLTESALPRRWRFAAQRRLHVLVGVPWTHVAVLPWQAGIESAAAWDEYARALFADQGVAGAALQIAVEDAPFGAPRLGVAIDASLLAALAAATAEAGWTLAGCRDVMSAAVATHLKALPADCVFAHAARGTVTCLFRRDGAWADAARQDLVAGQTLSGALSVAALLCGQPVGLPAYCVSAMPPGVPEGGGVVNLGSPDARLPALEAIEAAAVHEHVAASHAGHRVATEEGACSV